MWKQENTPHAVPAVSHIYVIFRSANCRIANTGGAKSDFGGMPPEGPYGVDGQFIDALTTTKRRSETKTGAQDERLVRVRNNDQAGCDTSMQVRVMTAPRIPISMPWQAPPFRRQ
jgi:hypothetical protein